LHWWNVVVVIKVIVGRLNHNFAWSGLRGFGGVGITTTGEPLEWTTPERGTSVFLQQLQVILLKILVLFWLKV
jgi:hypothetical protein